MYDSYRILSGLGTLVHTLGLQWPEESRIDGGAKKGLINQVAVKKEVVVSQYDKSAASKEVVIPRVEEPVDSKEIVVSRIDEPAAAPVAQKEVVAAAAGPVVTDKNIAPISAKQNETKYIPQEDVGKLVNKWLASWKSGDMKAYRSCYASDFQSKGKNLDTWVSYKANVYQKSKNIEISIDNLQISAEENIATAVFTQNYSSSILKDSGTKTLELRKINDEWSIYREIM
jgi:ketosteroid isomerase-like protein